GHDLACDDPQQLAAVYVEAMQSVQPAGPYHLAGWSAGGTIACAMAQVLEQRGETVDYLGLFDAPPPGVLTESRSDVEYLLTAAHYADARVRTKAGALPDDFEAALQQIVA